jgi:AraC-like DNA-binding protein/mannose-6-phosphate isomerase-like protein (cupin superfamily)
MLLIIAFSPEKCYPVCAVHLKFFAPIPNLSSQNRPEGKTVNYLVEPPISTKTRFFDFHIQSAEHAGIVMCGAHIHDWVEILFCLSGNMKATLGSREYPFGTHDLLVAPSHEVHRVVTLSEEKHEYAVVKFQPDLMITSMQLQSEYQCILPLLISRGAARLVFPAEEVERSGIPELVAHFAGEYQRAEYGYEIALKSDLYRLILWILRQWHAEGADGSEVPTPAQLRRLQTVLDYVGKNYACAVTVEEMARRCHVSYSYFSRQFSEAMGRSFHDYLTTVRLSAAEKLLITTEKSVTDISYDTGFSSLSYFSRRFAGRNGLSPSEYRARYSAAGLPRGAD